MDEHGPQKQPSSLGRLAAQWRRNLTDFGSLRATRICRRCGLRYVATVDEMKQTPHECSVDQTNDDTEGCSNG